MPPRPPAIGIDFGTTNSSVALATPMDSSAPPAVELVRFLAYDQACSASSRSILYLEKRKRSTGTVIESFTGWSAIDRYMNRHHFGDASSDFEAHPGRLIQSLKSYLAVRNLTGTEVFGRRFSIEELITRIVTDLRLAMERSIGHSLGADSIVVVGRPVRFVSSENPADDDYAIKRLTAALASAGLPQVTFLPEPVAAALAYESSLSEDELILIGDFGGGTSDFSLIRVGPSAQSLPNNQRIMGTAGLGFAGDAFDARLVRHLVSPALGSDSLARPAAKNIPAVPTWIYANLERWHYLSFLRTRNVSEILRTARLRALEPEKIEALITLIDEDLGYQLHQAVERTKIALSRHDTAEFIFDEPGLHLRTAVSRATFETWISPEIAAMGETIDTLLASVHIEARQVDRVFLTGGTSFVPAVRKIFDSRFTSARVTVGEAFTSVAQGLALHAYSLSNS